MMSTQTQAAAPDAGEPTVVVADDKATALAGLAWSDADDDETFSFEHDRTTFWLRLYVGITAAVVVFLGVVLWYVVGQHPEPEPAAAPAVPVSSAPIVTAPAPSGPDDQIVPSTTTEPAPAPQPVIAAPPPVTTEVPLPPPPPLPAPVPVDPDADRLYIEMLHGYGITTTQGSAAEIHAAHSVCRLRGNGEAPDHIAAEMVRENPGMSLDSALFVVGAAMRVYCPEIGE
jgi:hypothetical protein